MNSEYADTEEIEEKVIIITFPMYLRGYSIADSLDLLNGLTLEEILARRLHNDIVATNKHIKSTVGICQHSEQDYLFILNNKILKDMEKIVIELKQVLGTIEKIKNPSKRTKDLYGTLRSNMKEIQSLMEGENSNFEIPENFEIAPYYQMLKSSNYKKLKKARLDGEMLKE